LADQDVAFSAPAESNYLNGLQLAVVKSMQRYYLFLEYLDIIANSSQIHQFKKIIDKNRGLESIILLLSRIIFFVALNFVFDIKFSFSPMHYLFSGFVSLDFLFQH
jgi:hypothetical protein